MTVRDVKPFVGQLTVPYFMDLKLINAMCLDRECTITEAKDILYRKWMRETGHGH